MGDSIQFPASSQTRTKLKRASAESAVAWSRVLAVNAAQLPSTRWRIPLDNELCGRAQGAPVAVLGSSGPTDPGSSLPAVAKRGARAPWHLASVPFPLSCRAAVHDLVSALWLRFRGRQMAEK